MHGFPIAGNTFTAALEATCTNGGDPSSLDACTLTGHTFSGTWSGNFACSTNNTYTAASCTNGGVSDATCKNPANEFDNSKFADRVSYAACSKTGNAYHPATCLPTGPADNPSLCEQVIRASKL